MYYRMKRLAFLLLVFCSPYLHAQKADFKAAFKYTGDNLSRYYNGLSVYPTWDENQDYMYYRHESTEGVKYYLVDLKKNKKSLMFDNAVLAGKITAFTHESCDIPNFRIGSITFDKNNPDVFTFSKHGKDFLYNMKTGQLREYKKPEIKRRNWSMKSYWQKYSPDSTCYVYAWHHDLYLVKKGDTTAYRLTNDGENNHSYSSQRDKDTDKKVSASIYWAPDSKVFYSFRRNAKDVEDCWIINHLAKPRPTLRTYKFPMPGEKNVFTYDLHLFYPETLEHKVVDISKYPDQKVEMMRFDFKEQSKYIYFTRKSRTCDKMDLCRVDTKTGEVFEIISEESKPYWMDQLFECHILNNGEDIIWWSERTGYGQFYLYNKDGKLKSTMTKGEFVACKITKIDTINRSMIFEGYGRDKTIDPYYRMYYKVNFDGSGFTLLTPGDGYHDIDISKDGKYLVDKYSRVDKEPVSVLRNMNGKKLMELDKADLSLLYETGWKKPERIKVKAADGVTDLYGVMYKPFNFDPNKKYPVISNVYPGPQTELVPRSFVVDDNCNQSLAQLGFIVINIGHRGGSPFRHKHYHNYGYGNLRDYALADDKFAIEQLANRYSFIDIDRVGIYGHSGGGFMSTAAILTYPDFYKVAVSASGNHDNNIYTKWWGETHHGVKMEEKVSKVDGVTKKEYKFEATIPTNMELAGNLKGHLCLISGDVDVNVHMANTLRMADALIKKNKRFDLFIMPGKDHGLGSKYYINLIRYYFVEHLLGQTMHNVDVYDTE